MMQLVHMQLVCMILASMTQFTTSMYDAASSHAASMYVLDGVPMLQECLVVQEWQYS